MPVYHSHRLVFVHVGKTGGESIRAALHSAGVRDVEWDGAGMWDPILSHACGHDIFRMLRRSYPLECIATFNQAHLPADVLRELVSAEVWSTYFKFGIVRNPWDLLVSTYSFLKTVLSMPDHPWMRNQPDSANLFARFQDFSDFIRVMPLVATGWLDGMVTDAAGEVIVDFVGRFENLESDFARVCELAGIEARLERSNRSEHGHYRDYYTAETRAIVERHFARYIERFGYAY